MGELPPANTKRWVVRRKGKRRRGHDMSRPEDAQTEGQPVRDDQPAAILKCSGRHQAGEPGEGNEVRRNGHGHRCRSLPYTR